MGVFDIVSTVLGGLSSYLGSEAQAGASEDATAASTKLTQEQIDEAKREFNLKLPQSEEEFAVTSGLQGIALDQAWAKTQADIKLAQDQLDTGIQQFNSGEADSMAKFNATLADSQSKAAAEQGLTVEQYNSANAAKKNAQTAISGMNTDKFGTDLNYQDPNAAGSQSAIQNFLSGQLSPAQQAQMAKDIETGNQTLNANAATMGLTSGGRAALTNQLSQGVSQQYANIADQNIATGISDADKAAQTGLGVASANQNSALQNFLNQQAAINAKAQATAAYAPGTDIKSTYTPTAGAAAPTPVVNPTASSFLNSKVTTPASTPAPTYMHDPNGNGLVPYVAGAPGSDQPYIVDANGQVQPYTAPAATQPAVAGGGTNGVNPANTVPSATDFLNNQAALPAANPVTGSSEPTTDIYGNTIYANTPTMQTANGEAMDVSGLKDPKTGLNYGEKEVSPGVYQGY